MKTARNLAVLTVGVLIGMTIPMAGAHPESECPPCPCGFDSDGDGIPDLMDVGPPFILTDPDPEFHLPRPTSDDTEAAEDEAHDEEAVQRALDAIEAAEKGEEELDRRKEEYHRGKGE
jgi:hypothetical protein